jgi:hypothetical protein
VTADNYHPWSSVLRRLLDVLAANAQPFIKGAEIYYRWGQHIYDDVGDNTGQFGIHGTAEAVRANAAGVERLGRNTRYEKFLRGGVGSLIDWIEKPKKPLDINKTVKVGEWLGALAQGGADKIYVDRLAAVLLDEKARSDGGWNWDLKTPSEPILMPSLYALDGLVRAFRKYGPFNQEIKVALDFSLTRLEHEAPAVINDSEASLSWETALYKFCEVIDLLENPEPFLSSSHNTLGQLMRMASAKPRGILDTKRFEYRVGGHGQEEHAFCVLPTGLMRLYAYLWAKSSDLNFDLNIESFKNELSDFIQMTDSRRPFPFGNVGSCSHAVRLVARFGKEIDELIQDVQNTPRPGASLNSARPVLTRATDQYEQRSVRQDLYTETLKEEGVKRVKILQEFSEGYSGAHLDLCQITQTNNTPRILQVLKLDKLKNAKEEAQAAALAQEIIPERYRVELFKSYEISADHGLLRYRYAGQAGLLPSVEQFLKFVAAADETTLITDAIKKVYEQALAQAVSRVEADNSSLNETRDYFERKRENKFWSEILDGYRSLEERQLVSHSVDQPDYLILNFPFQTFENPLRASERTRDAWERPFSIDRAGYGHGDLNPRNILMVMDEERDLRGPVLIDFQRFSEDVPLPTDYARLEAGIQVKALRDFFEKAANDPSQQTYLVRYEHAVNAFHDFQLNEVSPKISTADVPRDLTRARKCVGAIRGCYLAAATPGGKKDLRGYFATLMLNYFSYLRPVYFEALSDRQRQFAFYCAASIFNRHFLYPAK